MKFMATYTYLAIVMLSYSLTVTAYAQWKSSYALRVKDINSRDDIKLVISSPVRRYSPGEPIEISAYLVNTGRQEYYVGKNLEGFLANTGFHFFEVTILNAENRQIHLPKAASDPVPGYKQSSFKENLRRDYMVLKPDIIYGAKDYLRKHLPPGKYRITIRYLGGSLHQIKEFDEYHAEFPFWTKNTVSNTLVIIIAQSKIKHNQSGR